MRKGEAFFQLSHLGTQTIISKILSEKFDFEVCRTLEYIGLILRP